MNLKFTLSFLMIFFSVKVFAQLEGSTYDHPESAPLITEEVTSIKLYVYDTRVFKFIPGESQEYTITSDSPNDPYARLFDGTDFSDSEIIAQGDDEVGANFVITYNVTAGTTYYLLIYDYEFEYSCNLIITGGTLPVELSSFTAANLNEGIILNWSTATEVNNYGFEIERASLGTTPGQAGSGQTTVGNRQETVGNENNQKSEITKLKWEKVGFVAGSGNSNSPKRYSYVDMNSGEGTVKYRLKQIDSDGKSKYYSQTAEVIHSLTGVKETQVPLKFELSQNYPNPFNPATQIKYQLPESGYTELKVYNLLGVEAATLVDEEQPAGSYNIEFNSGKYNLSSGIYLYRLKTNNFILTRKMILLK